MYPNDPSTPPEQPEQPNTPAAQPEFESTQQPTAPVQSQPVEPVQQQPEPAYAPPAQQQYPAQNADNPGKGLGIAGFILAFFFPLVGLPLSIVGFIKSKKAGLKNGLALAGIILNSISLLAGILMILVLITAYNGIELRANTSTAQATAQNVVTMAEMYAVESSEYDEADQLVSRYPKAFSDISSMLEDTTLASAALTSKPADPGVVEFYACGEQTGNKIGYWNYVENKVDYTYAGKASDSSTDCTLVTQ